MLFSIAMQDIQLQPRKRIDRWTTGLFMLDEIQAPRLHLPIRSTEESSGTHHSLLCHSDHRIAFGFPNGATLQTRTLLTLSATEHPACLGRYPCATRRRSFDPVAYVASMPRTSLHTFPTLRGGLCVFCTYTYLSLASSLPSPLI